MRHHARMIIVVLVLLLLTFAVATNAERLAESPKNAAVSIKTYQMDPSVGLSDADSAPTIIERLTQTK